MTGVLHLKLGSVPLTRFCAAKGMPCECLDRGGDEHHASHCVVHTPCPHFVFYSTCT